MKLFKSIISGFLAIAITVSLTIPVFAVDPGTVIGAMEVAPDFGTWLWSGIKGSASFIGSFISDDICPGGGENPGLNARHDFVPMHTQVNGKTGLFYVCRNCQKAAGEVLEPAYDDYVATLPAQGYTSAGGFIWYPTVSDISSLKLTLPENPLDGQTLDPSSRSFSISLRPGRLSGYHMVVFCAPFSGTYKFHDFLAVRYRYLDDDGVVSEDCAPSLYTSSFYKSAGEGINTRCDYSGGYVPYLPSTDSLVVYSYTLPSFEVIPEIAISADTYNINTRPTSITGGNYGIVGDNGQITKVEDNSTIINETNNTYYNPATGQTVPITGWTYDYSDRSYKVTMEGGKTSTVTYGDENISITETTVNESGDTITNNYTIYYLIDGSGSGEVCAHEWTETSTTPATCTMPGSKLSTCSKCQQTKTEALPALGHDWQVKQSVTTEYDDTGQLVQEGYIIYECSRCHEQYKAASGTSPPVNPVDPDASGEGVFSGIFGLLLDFLSFFFKTFKDFTKSGVKAFLGALQDGTSDIFGLLNPFDWSA